MTKRRSTTLTRARGGTTPPAIREMIAKSADRKNKQHFCLAPRERALWSPRASR